MLKVNNSNNQQKKLKKIHESYLVLNVKLKKNLKKSLLSVLFPVFFVITIKFQMLLYQEVAQNFPVIGNMLLHADSCPG